MTATKSSFSAPEQQHPVTVLTEAEMYYDPDGGGGEQ